MAVVVEATVTRGVGWEVHDPSQRRAQSCVSIWRRGTVLRRLEVEVRAMLPRAFRLRRCEMPPRRGETGAVPVAQLGSGEAVVAAEVASPPKRA